MVGRANHSGAQFRLSYTATLALRECYLKGTIPLELTNLSDLRKY